MRLGASDPTEHLSRLLFLLPLEPVRLLRARQRIRDYLHQHGAAPDDIDDIVLAIEEAMTNAVRHCGAEDDLEVRLSFEGPDLHAAVRDRGCGFDVAAVDMGQRPDPLEPGGRGLYLMDSLMDDMELSCDAGLEVRLLKRDVLPGDAHRSAPRDGVVSGGVLEGASYRDERQRLFVEEIDEGFAALDWQYRITYVNAAALKIYGLTREDALGRPIWDLFPYALDMDIGRSIRGAMENGASSIVEFPSRASGHWLEGRIYPTSSGVSIYLRDIDERKRREQRELVQSVALRGIATILGAALTTETEEQLGEVCLDVAQEVTGSSFGFVGRVAGDGLLSDVAISDPGWEQCAMRDQRGHRRPLGDIQLHGLYGRVIEDGVSLLANSPSEHPDSGGVPPDHPALTSYLGVPLKQGDTTVGIISMGNREGGYGPEQQEMLERLAPSVVEAFDRKRSEAALRASEERLRLATEAADLYGWELDLASGVFTVDERAERMVGLSLPSRLEDALDVIHPDDRSAVSAALEGAVATGEASMEFRLQDPSTDRSVWLFSGAAAVRGTDGVVTGLAGVTQNITRRKRLEEELRRREEQARHLIRYAPAAIYEIDFRGPRFVSVNDFMCEYSGYSRDELLAADPFDLLAGDGPAVFRQRMAASLAGETIPNDVEYRVKTKDGRIRRAILKVTPVMEDGKPVGAFVVAHDVTERAEAEETLQQELTRRSLLQRVALAASSARDLSTAAEQVIAAVRRHLSPHMADIRALNPVTNELDLLASFGYPESVIEETRHLGLERREYLSVRAFAARRLMTDADDERTPQRERLLEEYDALGDRYLVMPIFVGEAPIGTFRLSFEGGGAFSPAEIDLFNAVASVMGQAIEKAHLLMVEQQRRRRIEALHGVMEVAVSSLDVRESGQRILDHLVQHHGFELAGAWLARGETLELLAATGYPESYRERYSPMSLSAPFDAPKVFRHGRPIVVPDAADANPAVRRMYGDLGVDLGAYTILPLRSRGKTIGTLHFGWSEPHAMSPEDVAFYTSLGSELGVVLENADLYEAQQRIAMTLQADFIHPLPEIEGLELAALSLPAFEPALVGGDFHDVVRLVGGRVLVLIGDVMGKGIRATALTETVRSAVRTVALTTSSPAAILKHVNLVLLGEEERRQFVTALIMVLDPADGRLTLASAGHPPPVHVDGSRGRMVELAYGAPLGCFETMRSEVTELTLAPGDALVLWTDGVVDGRRDGELFGEDRLLETLSHAADRDPDALVERVRSAVLAFAPELKDDLQLLALRRVSAAARTAGRTTPRAGGREATLDSADREE
jgi:PAS domain S-box-containing protein